MAAKVLVAILAGFAIAIPSTFWLLKKVRIKSKIRHFQVSTALGMPIALFIYFLQTSFAVPIIFITVVFSLLVVALELTLRRLTSKSPKDYGSFSHGRSGGGLSYAEAKEAAGSYPDDYLTEKFWLEQRQARRSLGAQKLEFKIAHPNVTETHKIDSVTNVMCGEYSVSNGIRNTTDGHRSDVRDSLTVLLLGGSPLVGNEVPDRLTSSSFLQRMANDLKIKINVVNGGASGSSVLGRTKLLKNSTGATSVAVFIFGVNDAGWYNRESRKLTTDCVILPLRILRAIVDLGSEVANLAYEKILRWCYRKASRNAVNFATETLKDAYEFCNLNSVHMIAILEPNLYTRRTLHGYENRLISRFNRDLRTLILESYKQYEVWIKTVPYGVSATHIFDNSNSSVFLDWSHINARGHELVAEFIFDELRRRSLISTSMEDLIVS